MSLVLFAALAQAACTISEPPQIGASLFAPLGPQIPGPSPTQPKMPTPIVQVCPTKPDLAVQSIEMVGSTTGWAFMCTKITNKGGIAWASQAYQLSVQLTDVDSGSTASSIGFSALAPGASTTKCAWLRAPGVLRHGAPNPANTNECLHKRKVTSTLVFDPDIAIDASTANDDCSKTNNTKTVEVPYVTTCLI
jgi:hypothetical protein